MNPNIQLEPKHLQIVQSILKNYPYRFYVFGSRAKGNAKKYSDLDLAYEELISMRELTHLHEQFEESNLPFKVDLLNLKACDVAFKEQISKDLQLLVKG